MADLKVLFVATVDPTGMSGHNIATFEVISALVEDEDVELNLICPKPVGDNDSVKYLEEKIDRIYYLDSKVYRSAWHNVKLQFQMISLFKKAVKERKPDLIANRLGNCLTLPLLANVYRIPYYLLIRGLSGRDFKSRYNVPGLHYIWNIQLLLNCRVARLVIVAFKEIKDEVVRYRKKDQSPPVIFTNAVKPSLYPLTEIEEARSKINLSLNRNSFVVGFVGSIKKRHGLDLLINSLDLVNKKIDDYKIVVVGEGPELGRLRSVVKEKGIEDQVYFTGFIPHNHVFLYLAAADVLFGVLDPNEFENPIKCYEYLAAARPIITSKKTEFEFVKDNEYGLLIDDYSECSVAKAILKLYSVRKTRRKKMGLSGRDYVLQNHTWQQLVDIIKEDYNATFLI